MLTLIVEPFNILGAETAGAGQFNGTFLEDEFLPAGVFYCDTHYPFRSGSCIFVVPINL